MGKMFVLSMALAQAIIDMEDHGYSEGLGPEEPEWAEAWRKLVSEAERIAGRLSTEARSKQYRDRKNKETKTTGAGAS